MNSTPEPVSPFHAVSRCRDSSRTGGTVAASCTVAGILALVVVTAPVRAQAVPAASARIDTNKEDVSVMSEFKVYDKQPVPFTDANINIPRGVNDVQPYYIIRPEEIEVSGKTELDDFLKDSLTQNTVSETNAQVDPSALMTQLGATSTINLRGLGSSQTLILINGQRTSNFANRGVTYQPDMNGVPMAAIERVEVPGVVPPTFAQLTQRINKAGVAPPAPTAVFFDPVTNTSYASLGIQGNNPSLGPETSKNWNLGVIWQPQGLLKDFRFNLEYWKIDKLNLIRSVSNVQLLANLGDRAPAGSVTRDLTTGRIELFTFANYNVGNGSTNGWDVTADYRRGTRIGTFGVRARATITEHLKLPPSISYPAMEYAGFVNSGGVNKVKTNGALSWASGTGWRAVWSTVFQGGYKQAGSPGDPVYLGAPNPNLILTSIGPQGGYRVSSQIYHHVSVSRAFGAGTRGDR